MFDNMRAFLITTFFVLLALQARVQVTMFQIPDSVKAVASLAKVQVTGKEKLKGQLVSFVSNGALFQFRDYKKQRVLYLRPNRGAELLAQGIGVRENKKGLWLQLPETADSMQLMFVHAADTAAKFYLYSGYLLLPGKQWKLIGTYREKGIAPFIGAVSFAPSKEGTIKLLQPGLQVQRSNGSWKPLDGPAPAPSINLLSHVDSIPQYELERTQLIKAMASGKMEKMQEKEGVFYTILNEGNGRQVALSDTVSAFYKGWLWKDGSIFDQTKEQPARFPLSRLIRAWGITLPLLREGGKIRIVIPSALAYSIRTRSPKIPPNSILVFEVEVVKTEKAIL